MDNLQGLESVLTTPSPFGQTNRTMPDSIYTQANVLLGVLLLLICSRSPLAQDMAWFTDAAGATPFKQPLRMNDATTDRFILGRSFFSVPWVEAPSATTARDGLGPHFNANACSSCHKDNGSANTLDAEGQPTRALVFKLTQPDGHAQRPNLNDRGTPFHGNLPDPVYGTQIGINGNGKVKPEARTRLHTESVLFRYPDRQQMTLSRFHPYLTQLAYGPLNGNTVISLRQPPALAGLGLIEQVPDSGILAWADAQDANGDGISGRPNWLDRPGTPARRLGRFNWKASEASIYGQVANAAAHDIGLTNPLYPEEQCQAAQSDCRSAPRGRDTPQGSLDLPEFRLRAIAAYVAEHKAPQPIRLDARARQGRKLFIQIGCTACHRRNLTTGSGLAFHPYTDLLLHDMGSGLADGRPEFSADGREFRTAPLWGMGARLRAGERFLHDARAADSEQAILWHAGEAEMAQQAFIQLNQGQRASLLHFLEQL